jgi:PAS domain S-box-containing protein
MLLTRWFPGGKHVGIGEPEHQQDQEYWKSLFAGAARNISDALPYPVCTVDKNYRYTHFNRAHAGIMKTYFSADIGLGSPILDYFADAAHRDVLADIFRKVLAGETIKSTFGLTPETKECILETVFYPVLDDKRKVTGIATITIDITDHVRSAEAIEKISSRLQLATEAAGIGTWEWDIVRNDLVFDDQMFRLFGWNKGEKMERDVWTAALHPDDRVREGEITRRALQGEQEYDVEFRVIWPDGSLHWLNSKGKTLRNALGEPVKMVGVDYEITEHKLATTKLSQLTRLYAIQVEIVQAMVRIRTRAELFQVICDLMVNQGGFGAAWIGYHNPDTGVIEKEIASGQSIDPWPYPEINIHKGMFRNGLNAEAIRSGKVVVSGDISVDQRLREVHQTLNLQEFQSIAVVPFGDEGQPLWVLNLLAREQGYFMQEVEHKLLEELGEDISYALMMMEKDEKISRSTEALRESEAKYRLISENAGDVIWVMDPETGSFTYVSPSVFRLRGYTPEEVMERPVAESLTPGSFQIVNDLLVRNMEAFRQMGSQTMTFTTRVDQPCKDGSILPTEVTTTVFFNQQGRLEIIGVSRNIRERVRVEEEVRKLNADLENRVARRTAQLEEANRELEAFSYSVSHDLRAPLRAITGFSNILKQDYGIRLDEEGNRLCEVISSSAVRLGRLIDDLLAFSRLSRSEIYPGTVDMDLLVPAVYEELVRPEERERIDLTVSRLGEVPADLTMIKQVWVNLISNAVKYSSKKERAAIHITCDRSSAAAVFSITDNGIGFDMRYAGQLFSVFQRLHSGHDFEGTGVGLAIVQRIISKHGGKVWAEGAPGVGATFYFSLPASEN